MLEFVHKGARCMCTGCPGMIARLDPKVARTAKLSNKIQATEDDKDFVAPAFGTCLAIPTAPKKCSPSLVKWVNVKSDVKIKGKKAILFPNTSPCTTGPGVVTMISASSKYSIGAKLKKGKEVKCDWEGCNSPVHDYQIKYPGGGIVWRDEYTPDWTKPHVVGYPQVCQKKFHVITWASKGITYQTTPSNYPTRNHHVIPVNVMEGEIPGIRKNLELLTWDMNSGTLNGICLPFNNEDICWHDLQAHRGSHPAYDGEVIDSLTALQGKIKNYCVKEDQDKLLSDIATKVEEFKNNIINWVWPLHGDSFDNRDKC